MYFLSFSSLHNNNNNNNNSINNNNNNHNNNSNNNNKNIILPYTSLGFYSSLYTFTLNIIINTYLFKESISPVA